MVDDARAFKVDLQHLDDMTARIRAFKQFVADNLTELDNQVSGLGTKWTGAAAAAYSQAHAEWATAATDVQDGLQTLEDVTRGAHKSYTDAVTTNVGMLKR